MKYFHMPRSSFGEMSYTLPTLVSKLSSAIEQSTQKDRTEQTSRRPTLLLSETVRVLGPFVH